MQLNLKNIQQISLRFVTVFIFFLVLSPWSLIQAEIPVSYSLDERFSVEAIPSLAAPMGDIDGNGWADFVYTSEWTKVYHFVTVEGVRQKGFELVKSLDDLSNFFKVFGYKQSLDVIGSMYPFSYYVVHPLDSFLSNDFSNEGFGMSLAPLGKLFAENSVPDVAVGDPLDDTGGTDRGAVYIFDLRASQYRNIVYKKLASSQNGVGAIKDGDGFGSAIAPIGDIDGDGVRDIAVGAPLDDTGGVDAGAVYVLMMNKDGSVKNQVKLAHSTNGMPRLQAGDWFGVSLSPIGDFNKDGMNDLLVGAPYDDTNGRDLGALYILFLGKDGRVNGYRKLVSNQDGMLKLKEGDRFGISVISIDDQDADGVLDIAVGADMDDELGADTGAVYFLNLNENFSVKSVTKVNSGTLSDFSNVTFKDDYQKKFAIETLSNVRHFGRNISVLGDVTNKGSLSLVVTSGEFNRSIHGGKFLLHEPRGIKVNVKYVDESEHLTDTDGDLIRNLADLDADDDTVLDATECLMGEILCKSVDSDADGVPDVQDVNKDLSAFNDRLGTDGIVSCNSSIIGNSQIRKSIDIVIAIDVSGYARNKIDGKSFLQLSAEAAENLIKALPEQDRIGILPFSSSVDREINIKTFGISKITSDRAKIKEQLDEYKKSILPIASTFARTSEAILLASPLFNRYSSVEVPKILLILGRGERFGSIQASFDNLDFKGTYNDYTEKLSDNFKAGGLNKIFTIVHPTASNIQAPYESVVTAQSVATDPSYAYFPNEVKSLPDVVEGLLKDICTEVSEQDYSDKDNDGISDDEECVDLGEKTVCFDTDGDGTPDYVDEDSDNDGTLDKEECIEGCVDRDGDGIVDYLDPDTNRDNKEGNATSDVNGNGISDKEECGKLVGVYCEDKDGDSIPDYFDSDKDNDGISDDEECVNLGEKTVCFDTDGDGTPDYVDEDSDNDGTLDKEECIEGCVDRDGDGIVDYLDPDTNRDNKEGNATSDVNGNGISDKEECGKLVGVYCEDKDGDSIPDYFDSDKDNDGISDDEECVVGACNNDPTSEVGDDMDSELGEEKERDNSDDNSSGRGSSDDSNPTNPSKEETAVPEATNAPEEPRPEVSPVENLDPIAETPVADDRKDKNILPPIQDDSDNDSYPRETDEPEEPSSDLAQQKPLDADSDGIPDSIECFGATNCQDTDGDGLPNYQDPDSDDDFVPDSVECPDARKCPDTDGDGIPDFLDNDTNQANPSGNPNGDLDQDGYEDRIECPNWLVCFDGDKDRIPDMSEENEEDISLDLRQILVKMSRIAKRVQEVGDSSLGYVYAKTTRRRPLLNGIQGLESMKLSAEVGDERAKIEIKQVGSPLCIYSNGRRGRPYSRVLELSGQRYRDSLRIIGEELPIYSHNPRLVDRQQFRCSRPNVRVQMSKLSRLVKATRDMVLVNYRQCELEDSRTKRFSQNITNLYEQFRKYEKVYLKRLVICERVGDK